MTGDDNILARWSRRKLATRLDDASGAPETEHLPSQVAKDDAALFTEPGPPETEAEELDAQAVEALPRIEDLTAESDVTAFLKKGVPMALKRAALRKIWSLDPGIRDYVGPSEYAWDFNQPGSMAGFGALDANKETVVGFLSKAARAIDRVAEPAEATQTADPVHEQTADDPPRAAPAIEQPEAAPAKSAPTDSPPETGPPTLVTRTDASLRVEADLRPQPRHGGAMPR